MKNINNNINIFVAILIIACLPVMAQRRGGGSYHRSGDIRHPDLWAGLAIVNTVANVVSAVKNDVVVIETYREPTVVYTEPIVYERPVYIERCRPTVVYVSPRYRSFHHYRGHGTHMQREVLRSRVPVRAIPHHRNVCGPRPRR